MSPKNIIVTNMHTPLLREMLWNQFGASIDMLANIIAHAPDEYFQGNKRFYYIAFHSAIFLDYYLTLPPHDFKPLLAFTPTKIADRPKESIDDLIPDKIYSKTELLNYIKHSREKCKALLESLTDEKMTERFIEGDGPDDMNYPVVEILLYNMRHTQHHAAQLNMLLRQDRDVHMEWSFRAGDLN